MKTQTGKKCRQTARLAMSAMLMLMTVVSLVGFSGAQEAKNKPDITVAQLAGPWQITVVGNTGCGASVLLLPAR